MLIRMLLIIKWPLIHFFPYTLKDMQRGYSPNLLASFTHNGTMPPYESLFNSSSLQPMNIEKSKQ